MAPHLYPVIAEWDEASNSWSLLAPDFPEVASSAQTREEIVQQAEDALLTAIDARIEDGEAIPSPATEISAWTKHWILPTRNMLLHVPVLETRSAPILAPTATTV